MAGSSLYPFRDFMARPISPVKVPGSCIGRFAAFLRVGSFYLPSLMLAGEMDLEFCCLRCTNFVGCLFFKSRLT